MSAKDYSDLVSAFKSTKGFEVYSLVQSIRVSFGIFAGNEQVLNRKLGEHTESASLRRFSGIGNRRELDEEFREIIRLLHNYVAAAMSLVEHTRRIARKLLRDNYLRCYQDQVNAVFTDDPVTGFIHDLRNFLLHFSHAPVSRVIRFAPTHIASVGIELLSDELLCWDNWSPRGRCYIKSHDEGIDLSVVIAEYGAKVHDFSYWIQDHIGVAFNTELKELWAKHDEWASFCRVNGIPVCDSEFYRPANG
jgi:hypothetical protein